MTERIWLDSQQAAEYAGRHHESIRAACASGELHGTQRVVRGKWRIHRDCLDAWMLGEPCAHKQRRAS